MSLQEIEADFEAEEGATPEQLAAVVNAARELARREKLVGQLEEQLKKAKEDLKASVEVLVPKAMEEAGMQKAPLGPPGWYVEVNDIVKASIPSPHSDRIDNAPEKNAIGMSYLEPVAPDLIKMKLVAYFGRDEYDFARKVQRDFERRKRKVRYTMEKEVHTGTLTSWVKRQDEAGLEVDEVALNVRRFKAAKIVRPSERSRDKLK